MPAVTSGKVLVTGATGFVAGGVIESLLQHGYSVRATVRSERKGTPLIEKLAEYRGKIELAIVEDMVKDGAYDDAVKGVDAIMHVASPVHLDADDPNELIIPAVAGTMGVLESARQYGSSVKRVVFTSSCATIITVLPDFHTFNDDDWNNSSIKEVEEKGRAASPIDKYRASKTLAERAAWNFMEKYKTEIGFDFVTIHPPWVFGTNLLATSPEQLNTSMKAWYDAVHGTKDNEYLASTGGEWVNLKEVALAHVRSIQRESAGGHRIITAAGPYKWQHWVTSAHSMDESLPAGDPNFANPTYQYRFDATKSTQLLGIEYTSMEQTTKEILAQFKQLGWIA